MIPAVRGRRSFAALRHAGRRARAGGFRVTVHADATPIPRLALAINRSVATAVDRNRARRRLRVLFASLAARRPDLVPPGDYLVAVLRVDFTDDQAVAWLTEALEELRRT